MPSKMDCKEMRLTRFCRFWLLHAFCFFGSLLCHVRGVATYDLFRESHPLTEPGHDLNGALGKELSTHEVGGLAECVENFTMDSPDLDVFDRPPTVFFKEVFYQPLLC